MKITTKALSFIVLIFFFEALSLSAQVNLVPNPSFESFTNCPESVSEIYQATSWVQPTTGTSDYFNVCCVSTIPLSAPPVGIPDNLLGIQNARTGNGYAGFIVHDLPDTTDLSREYLQVRLVNPMIPGNQYLVRFFVSLSDFSSQFSNGIGAYFSTAQIHQSDYFPLPYTPQINASGMINNYEDWTEITETFTPDSAFEYLTIGNFYLPHTSLIDTFTAQIDSSSYAILHLPLCYYYIDDVSVISLDTTSGLSETEKPNIKIFPNPASSRIEIWSAVGSKQYSVEVCDMLGQVVYQSDASPFDYAQGDKRSMTINVEHFAKDIYLLEVKEKGEAVFWEKVVVE